VILASTEKTPGARSLVLSIILLTALPIAGHAGKTSADFDTAYQAAEAARKQAAALGYEWNTIRPLLRTARKAAGKGDFDRAVKLAEEARLHGELAVEQAAHEDEHWIDAVPRLPEKTGR
jgi:hypothetical protein